MKPFLILNKKKSKNTNSVIALITEFVNKTLNENIITRRRFYFI